MNCCACLMLFISIERYWAMRIFAALILFAAIWQPVDAQEESMELQRCIWSCLSEYGPADNPAYHQCVARVCDTSGGSGSVAQNTARSVDAREQWIAGRTQSGVGYAGVDGQYPETGLYYFCGQGQSFLRVVGMSEDRRSIIIFVDETRFQLPFRLNQRDQFEVELPYTAPVIQALQAGNRLRIMVEGTDGVMEAPLRGSRAALAQVISNC